MSIVGEAALSASFKLLFSKLASSEFLSFVTEKQVRKQLEEWQKILPSIQAVLDDAEEKQMKDGSVKIWLDELQDLAYDVDDVLDEFATEALRRKLQGRDQPSTSKVRKFLIPTCCTTFTPPAFMFNKNMIYKIEEIAAKLNSLALRRSQLGLREINGGGRSKMMNPRLQPTSLVDEAHVYGRDKEKLQILELLKNSDGGNDGVVVIPIVGMGGIGKTTIAQLVYNDDSINSLFDLKAWVYVSDDFDVIRVTKTILQSITSEPCDQNDLNLLQVKLKEKLSGKKFLLVLDDTWNENYNDWIILRSPFGVGTKIIVTTRSEKISSKVGTVETFSLHQLPYDVCLSVFTQRALGARDFNGHPELKEVGANIVRKCDGLPLAATAIGGLLRTDTDLDAWKDISRSEIWDLPDEECDIIPALKLSYYHLPSHLKQCFAYCSILPKDYEFKEEEIILLWQAEGFLQQTKASSQIEGLGRHYFRDLLSRSFFQISGRDKSRFVMHDLVNDLAQSVAGEIYSKLEGDKRQKFSARTRHFSFISGQYDGVKRFEAFDKMKHLRTFLPFQLSNQQNDYYLTNTILTDLLPHLRCLRVLSLKRYHITKLPDIFENLEHLRYLDFSYTFIQSLPDSIYTLYNLEILILTGCHRLTILPSKLGILVNLQYLDIAGADFEEGMPLGIGQLTNIQRLSHFVLSKCDGHQIREMKNLSNLKRNLSFLGLENIVKAQDALEAKLSDKLSLDGLNLTWGKGFRCDINWEEDFGSNIRNKDVEEEVLNFLRPHRDLKKLTIGYYGGAKFPTWVGDPFQNLLSLELNWCKNCKSLPSIGKLPLLKDFLIVGMNELNKVGVEFIGDNPTNAFASLERLSFNYMLKWTEWEQVLKFPSLKELSIIDCPQLLGRLPKHLPSLEKLVIRRCTQLLVSISDLPMLTELEINECAELVLGDHANFPSLKKVSLRKILKFCTLTARLVSRLAKLEYLKIDGWEDVTQLSQREFGLLEHLRSLHNLKIEHCPQLVSLEPEEVEDDQLQLGKLCNIHFLTIMNCERLERLPKVLHLFKFLIEMRIEGCPSIDSFSKSNFPPALKKMKISDCVKLRCLVDEGETISFINTSPLEHLAISNCPSLICLSLPTRLQHLEVWECSILASVSPGGSLPTVLKRLKLYSCRQLESIAQSIEGNACLEVIEIDHCENIKSLPRGLDRLNHLQKILIYDCPNFVSFAESGLPTTSLIDLMICRCENFRALPNCMHNLTSLQKITIIQCPNLVSFVGSGLPTTSLADLEIHFCENFRALPNRMHNLTSLQRLDLVDCSAEISFPEEGLPTNLKGLSISGPKICRSLFEWGLHRLTFLEEACFYGKGCFDVVSFPQEELGMMLPPSLSKIRIFDFENLKYLSSKGFQNLTSLQVLSLVNCPKLRSLPEKDMLLSLLELRISGSPLLKEGRKRDIKGREWSKIAHVPRVSITDYGATSQLTVKFTAAVSP